MKCGLNSQVKTEICLLGTLSGGIGQTLLLASAVVIKEESDVCKWRNSNYRRNERNQALMTS
jgi:hypothetical protein